MLPPVSVYYHTHWDREWYMPFRSYQVRLAEVVDDILAQLESKELQFFMLDGQTVILEDYLELRPDHAERLKKWITSGKITVGPWYVMPDSFLVGGESLIRNLQKGIEQSRLWGCNRFTGYLPDTFGHSADTPTLMAGVGIDSVVVWRGVNPDTALFHWDSPSGERVLAFHLTEGYFQMMLHDWNLQPDQKRTELEKVIAKLQLESPLPGQATLLPLGGDHLALPSVEHREYLKQVCPNHVETTPDCFLAALQNDAETLNRLTTVTGELVNNEKSFLLPGVYSSRLYLKQMNRYLEHRLVSKLEPLLALAEIFKLQFSDKSLVTSYPKTELALAWKQLLLNHPHDSICGCSIDSVHRENEQRFEQVLQITDALMHRAVALIANKLSGQLIVFNMGATPYTGVVPVCIHEDSDKSLPVLEQEDTVETILQNTYQHSIHRIPLAHLTQQQKTGWIWVNNLPANGLQVLTDKSLRKAPVEKSVQKTPLSLRHEWLHVQVNAPSGQVAVWGKEPGNQSGKTLENLFYLQATPEQGDSYNGAPVKNGKILRARFTGLLDSREERSSQTLRGTLTLQYRFDELNVDFTVILSVQAGSPLLEIEVKHPGLSMPKHKLQLCFDTEQPLSEIYAESHLSVVRRTVDRGYNICDHMPAERFQELRTNTAPVQRFFSANGHSWITKGLTEYECSGCVMSVTLHRPFSALSSDQTGVRGAQAGPPLDTPEGLCLNRTLRAELAWCLTPATTARLYELTESYYGQVWGVSGSEVTEQKNTQDSLADLTELKLITWMNAPELVRLSCYWLPDRGLVLRLLNTENKTVYPVFQTGFPCQQLELVNFLHEPTTLLPLSVDDAIAVNPYDVQTVLFKLEPVCPKQ